MLATIAGSLALAAAGMLGPVCLGDECDHFRAARGYSGSLTRRALDPLTVLPDRQCPTAFIGTPLWHMGLGLSWRLSGGPVQWVAQLYQGGFYALLALSVYFLVRRAWDESAASWAWLAVTTTPMICVYSVVLYQDVPGVAVSMLGLLLLWRRNFLASGLVLGIAYLTKMNMLSFAPPACLLALWRADGDWRQRLAAAVKVGLPILAAFSYDAWWHYHVFEYGFRGPRGDVSLEGLTDRAANSLNAMPAGYVLWKPFPYYSPVSIVSHLGLLTLGGALLALIRCWDAPGRWMWLAFAFCVAGFYAIFVRLNSPQIRYLMPAAAIMAVLCGGALRNLRLPRWLLVLAIAGSFAQAAGATAYAAHRRQILPGEQAAYEWVRRNTTPRDRVLHPEPIVMNAAGRPQIWEQVSISYFTTRASDEIRSEVLAHFDIKTIVVPRRRIYDSAKEGPSVQGYPADFVEHIRHVDYLELVLENDDAIVFRVRPRSPVASQPVAPQAASAPAP